MAFKSVQKLQIWKKCASMEVMGSNFKKTDGYSDCYETETEITSHG